MFARVTECYMYMRVLKCDMIERMDDLYYLIIVNGGGREEWGSNIERE